MSLPDELRTKITLHDGRIWRGNLNASQIISLVDDHDCACRDTDMQRLLRKVRSLKAENMIADARWWFYFVPPSRLDLHHKSGMSW